jgi:hypothetical protein
MGLSKEINIPSGVTVNYWKVESFHTYWDCNVAKPGDVSLLPEAVQIAYAEIEAAKKKDVTTDIYLSGYVTKEARDLGLPPIHMTTVTIKQAPQAITGTDPRSVLYLLTKVDARFADALDIIE